MERVRLRRPATRNGAYIVRSAERICDTDLVLVLTTEGIV
jgi:hypothetical protein